MNKVYVVLDVKTDHMGTLAVFASASDAKVFAILYAQARYPSQELSVSGNGYYVTRSGDGWSTIADVVVEELVLDSNVDQKAMLRAASVFAKRDAKQRAIN